MLANLVLCVVHVLLHGNWNNFYEKCDIALRNHMFVCLQNSMKTFQYLLDKTARFERV